MAFRLARFVSSFKSSTLSTIFEPKPGVNDLHRLVQGFAHVVDGQGGNAGCDKRFHFNASLRGGSNFRRPFQLGRRDPFGL